MLQDYARKQFPAHTKTNIKTCSPVHGVGVLQVSIGSFIICLWHLQLHCPWAQITWKKVYNDWTFEAQKWPARPSCMLELYSNTIRWLIFKYFQITSNKQLYLCDVAWLFDVVNIYWCYCNVSITAKTCVNFSKVIFDTEIPKACFKAPPSDLLPGNHQRSQDVVSFLGYNWAISGSLPWLEKPSKYQGIPSAQCPVALSFPLGTGGKSVLRCEAAEDLSPWHIGFGSGIGTRRCVCCVPQKKQGWP